MKNKLFYGLMAATGLLFAGCSSEDILENVNKPLEADQTFYVSMRISGDNVGGSRAAKDDGNPVAGDFADGTGVESIIDKAYFVFYNEDGDVVGDIVDLEIAPTDWSSEAATGTVEKYCKKVAKVSVTKGEKAPAQVICYLNPVDKGNLGVVLDQIQTLALSTVVKGSGTSARFPMSNSVYYANDNAETTPSIAVPLELNVNLFTTEAAAEAALNDENNKSYAKIYVERYATKLTFDATKTIQTDFKTGQRVWKDDGTESNDRNLISLHFTPQYWAVNAEAKQTYVIKSFRAQAPNGALLGENYTFNGLNEIINNTIDGNTADWKWNDPDFHRSYWGMSPAYFTNTYPEVSSDLDPKHSELQKYISYNELPELGFEVGDVNEAGVPVNSSTQYFKETTVGRVALDSKNPAAAVASVIYVGKYSVSVNGVETPDTTSFYTYLSGPVPGATADADNQPYIYFRNTPNTLTSNVAGTTSMLKRFLIQCSILYKKVGDNYVAYELGDGTGLDGLASKLSVSQLTDDERKHYNGTSTTGTVEGENEQPQELKLQHNARTLRFKDVPESSDNIYVLTYNGYKEVVANTATPNADQITLEQANIALAKNVGYAYYYTSGHAYFNIPVKHFGWYRKGNENNKENAIFDWSKVRVGDFGMVRNHAYNVEIGTIKGLALGIGGDDVELVPPSSETNYYVFYQVHILKWAIVPTQGVDL